MERYAAPPPDASRLFSADQFVETIQACARLGREIAWSSLEPLLIDHRVMARNRIVTNNHSDAAHDAFDMLRTRILQMMRQNGWTSVAITSPTRGCGKSTVALNLAFSLAHQRDCRTVLMDFDLKHPRLAAMTGMTDPQSMESFLKREIDIPDILQRYGENLAIAANSQPVRLAAELLQNGDTGRVLADLRERMKPDVLLFDMTAMLTSDEVTAFLPNVDGVIIVAAAEQSTIEELEACERDLAERTNVLGVVLNRCRHGPGY
ncbi:MULTISPECIES: CpsD/CapB family tyrosine-protein kinase [unclassified Rhizobium]|uniref:CpsD/CapB family tyrosine-protein kinase n=1 Tax=unclassified Rhizobium TaxID=2613769 RepID=UPI0006FACACD|nr:MULTISPECIES: CpsD/CapB family tyrosine-protein kinase [unclassified Rhizobium]KQV33369.1 chromosome partitioning protein [Rhizobium sp. Root1212]KRD22503.1 chromosome partitioning protein [Rhizobium sp. Root268]